MFHCGADLHTISGRHPPGHSVTGAVSWPSQCATAQIPGRTKQDLPDTRSPLSLSYIPAGVWGAAVPALAVRLRYTGCDVLHVAMKIQYWTASKAVLTSKFTAAIDSPLFASLFST